MQQGGDAEEERRELIGSPEARQKTLEQELSGRQEEAQEACDFHNANASKPKGLHLKLAPKVDYLQSAAALLEKDVAGFATEFANLCFHIMQCIAYSICLCLAFSR